MSSQQQTLDVALRAHDLPPKWDGLVVVWGGWRALPQAFICPPKRPDVCPGCGSTRECPANIGRVAVSTSVTRRAIEENDESRARLPGLMSGKLKRNAYIRLMAFRCPDCLHDVVVDTLKNESWDLDVTDYGDEGSAA